MTNFPAIAIAYYNNYINDLPITDAEHRAVEYWCDDNDLIIQEMLSDIEASLVGQVAKVQAMARHIGREGRLPGSQALIDAVLALTSSEAA